MAALASAASPRPLEGEALERTSVLSLFTRVWKKAILDVHGEIGRGRGKS